CIKTMKYLMTLTWTVCCTLALAQSQPNAFIAASGNLTGISISNDYELANSYYPRLGFGVAIGYPIVLGEYLVLLEGAFVHTSLRDETDVVFTGINGNLLWGSEYRIESSNSVGISGIIRKPIRKFNLGLGMNSFYLISSKTRLKN